MKVKCNYCKETFDKLYAPGKCFDCRLKERKIELIVKGLWKLTESEIDNIVEAMGIEPIIVEEIPEGMKNAETDKYGRLSRNYLIKRNIL